MYVNEVLFKSITPESIRSLLSVSLNIIPIPKNVAAEIPWVAIDTTLSPIRAVPIVLK